MKKLCPATLVLAALTLAGAQLGLAESPKANLYYRVHLFAGASRADLAAVSRILDYDGEQYLVEVEPDAIERFIAVPAMRGRVSLDGRKVDRPAPEFPPVVADPRVEQMVARVSPDSVLAFVRRLQDFGNRYALGESCKAAARWIAAKFREYGCDTVILQDHDANYAPNVVGVRYGTLGRRRTYAVIDGHFDAIPWSPGADDNASGTVSAIEACRVTQGFQFRNDLRFIAFSAEEEGLGSPYYADQARKQGDSILGVLNFDMIGYADYAPEDLDVIGKISDPACEPFCDWFIAVADTYTALLCNKQMMSDMPYSDHASFWNNGYLALCCSEDFWPPNPYYHTAGDSIGRGYNDNAFCTEVIKAGVAALASLGEPLPAGVASSQPLGFGPSGIPRLTLEQNPVRDIARIGYVLPQACRVSLEAFDRSGSRLAIIVSGYSSPGAHSATWDTRNVPAGICFLRLTAASGQRSLKAVVGR